MTHRVCPFSGAFSVYSGLSRDNEIDIKAFFLLVPYVKCLQISKPPDKSAKDHNRYGTSLI